MHKLNKELLEVISFQTDISLETERSLMSPSLLNTSAGVGVRVWRPRHCQATHKWSPLLSFALGTDIHQGHREVSMYKEFKCVIPTATALGGAVLGMLPVPPDLMGVFDSGTSILMAVTIMYSCADYHLIILVSMLVFLRLS